MIAMNGPFSGCDYAYDESVTIIVVSEAYMSGQIFWYGAIPLEPAPEPVFQDCDIFDFDYQVPGPRPRLAAAPIIYQPRQRVDPHRLCKVRRPAMGNGRRFHLRSSPAPMMPYR